MHENAGNIGLRMDFFESLYEKLEVNIVAFGYRGYSYSEGSPSEEGLKKDADAIVNYLQTEQKINQRSIFIQGRSLGGAVTLYTASKYPDLFRGVIAENTFTSMSAMVDKVMPFAKNFKHYILKNHWKSIDIVKELKHPVLFVTGNEDELVPYEMTLEMHDNARESRQKELFVVMGGTHNDTWHKGGKQYIAKIKDFIKDCMFFEKMDRLEMEANGDAQKKRPKVKKV